MNTTTADNITIVTATDNHYIVLLAALLKSIEMNHLSDIHIDFYIVGDNLSANNIRRLEQSVTSEKITIYWLEMTKIIPQEFNLPLDKSSYPLNIYMRLFIPYFLPDHIKKVIYLDVDMIVLKDISALWEEDLKGNIIGAVQDLIKTVGDPQGGIANFEELGMDKKAKYFNTGLLVIDRDRWLLHGITKKVLNCVESNKGYAKLPDQYGLNVVLHRQWFELNPLWNSYSSLDVEDPFIIHFFHRKPIYVSYDKSLIYRDLFYKYLNLTEWKHFKPIGEGRRYLKKIMNILKKKIS
jgi:lipopolysaccharide biosynthesis glycosyltransferase